ncbi:MAG: response regulator [Oscillochloridaceae bacterium umkhey_bin13]
MTTQPTHASSYPMHLSTLIGSSERYFYHLLDQLPTAAYTCDAHGLITHFNQQAEQVWGRTPQLHHSSDRYCGSFQLFLPDGTPMRHEECWMARALLDQREYNGYEVLIARPNGSRRLFLAHANPIFDEEHQLIGAVNVLVDISAHKAAEEERRIFESKIQHAQKLESLGVLAGGIAHDFNNLLTAMLGYASLAALDLPSDSQASQMLHEIEAAAQRAADLARQMLTYAGRNTFAPQALRLDQLVADLARLLETVVSKRATLQMDLTPVTITGDQSQIGQVVMNLITNAAEALDDRPGSVSIRTGLIEADAALLKTAVIPGNVEPGRYACIEVIDTGSGMDTATLNRIFELFYSTKFTGRGLGLAAVLGIVKSHGGTITVTSTPGVGSQFRVLFPATDGSVHHDGPAQTIAPARLQGTVLVIDDDASVRGFVRRVLERAGLHIHEAASGREGLDTFAAKYTQIDAVILDLTMPDLGGHEVLRTLRAIHPEVAVLIISGYSAQEVTNRLTEPVDALLQKPFRPSELLAQVQWLLRG